MNIKEHIVLVVINKGKYLQSNFNFKAVEIAAKRVDTTLQFAVLKKLNRLAHIRCKKVRDATNEVTISLSYM